MTVASQDLERVFVNKELDYWTRVHVFSDRCSTYSDFAPNELRLFVLEDEVVHINPAPIDHLPHGYSRAIRPISESDMPAPVTRIIAKEMAKVKV